MKITLKWLKDKGACAGGVVWFKQNFKEEGEYQAILDALAKENRRDWANWLLQNAGSTEDVLDINGDIAVGDSVFFSGSLKVTGKIACKFLVAGRHIKAGEGIEAGWGIKAGEGIEAGWGIKAGGGIEAGADYGIYAGLSVRVSLKKQHALVISDKEPKNLLLGVFKQKERKKTGRTYAT